MKSKSIMDDRGDKIYEAKDTSSSSEGNVYTVPVGAKAVAHGSLDFECTVCLVLVVDL